MNYIIEFSDGSHGILPNDNLEYSVSRGRVIVYKNGEKVLDKEITDCPSGKCEIIVNKDSLPDVQTIPIDGEIPGNDDKLPEDGKINNEYNIGNMLPQVGLVPTVNQAPLMMAEDDESEEGDVEEIGPISPEANASFLTKYIADCRKKLEYEKSKAEPNKALIDDIKAKLDQATQSLSKYNNKPELKAIDGKKANYIAASDSSVEDGEVVTEISAVGAAAIGAGSIAALWGVLGGGFFKLGEMGVDKIVQVSKRPKYKKILDAYYDYFMVNKAPKFSSLKKRKYFAKETGDEKNPILGWLKKYGAGKETAVVDYFYEDKSVCGCYVEKKYKAAFDWFTIAINGGDVVKFDYGITKHIQPKMFAYQQFANYYIAYMDLMLGFTDKHFMDIVRDIKVELKKHESEIKDLKKESVDVEDEITLTLTEAAIDYINLGNDNVEESAKDAILNFVSEVNVSRKIRVLIVELAIMRARLDVLTKANAKPEKIAKLKRDIIAKEKEKRALLNSQTQEVKSEVKKIEKVAVKEAKKEVKSEKPVTESFQCTKEGNHVIGVMPDGTKERFDSEEEYHTAYREAEHDTKESTDVVEEKELLSVKILKDKIKANEERLKNANKEPKKHASLINALKKDNEEYEDRIRMIKAKVDKDEVDEIEESVGDLESDEIVTEALSEAAAFGVSALAMLTIFSLPALIQAYQKHKRDKRYKLEVDAMRSYPIKHPDAPKLSQISRKKFIISAFDGSRGKSVDDNNDRAQGMYEFVYYYKKKEIVIVQKSDNRIAAGICKDLPAKVKEHKDYVYAMILLYKHNWITPNISKFLDKEIKENEMLRKKYNGKLVPDTDKKIKVESAMDNYVDALSSFVTEAANIDPVIKDTIATLNSKGYKTRYSSAGHYNLRRKEDKEPDGVYYGKLYSDARVQFKGTYHFGAAPKYWFWKKVDGDDYLDVIPIAYSEKDGTPDKAFDKWRDNYLGTLKRWVDDLPNASEKKEDDPTPEDKNIKEESERITLELDTAFDAIFRENGIR